MSNEIGDRIDALLDEQLLAPLQGAQPVPGSESVRLDVSALMLPDALVKQASTQLEHRRRLERLRASALEGGDRVKPHISAKVLGDYDERLKAARATFAPIREQLVARLKVIRDVEATLRQRRQELEDHLDELRFRSSLGEFDADRLTELEREQGDLGHELALQLDLIDSTYDTARSVLDAPLEQLVDDITQRLRRDDLAGAIAKAEVDSAQCAPEPSEPAEPQALPAADDGALPVAQPEPGC